MATQLGRKIQLSSRGPRGELNLAAGHAVQKQSHDLRAGSNRLDTANFTIAVQRIAEGPQPIKIRQTAGR
jgi:hypothetical protein